MTAARDLARAQAARLARYVSTTSYLQRWLVLGAAIGIIAGSGAVLFYEFLRLCTDFFLQLLVGYRVPRPFGESLRGQGPPAVRPWAIPLVVALGGLISGLLVFRFAPDAEGHGTDAAIAAVTSNPRGIRLRTVVVKFFASGVTIGSGGSGGREGPTAQISAGFGSFLARVLNLTPADARIAVSVGIGAGIGAIFKAPLGGAVLAAEIVYREDVEVEALLPAIVASVISYALFAAVEGFTPLFGYLGHYAIGNPAHLGWFALIGAVAGLIGLAYARGFYGMAGLFGRSPVPRILRPALGGLAVGLMALAVPQVLGTGYGWIQLSFTRSGLLHLSLWIVLALPLAKIVATGLSIGSGGSGGIFGPGLMIGAFTGAALWRVFEPFGAGVPHQPAGFVIVGMMACFGSISRAPLAVMLMVAEMTDSIEILAPAMIAVGVATLIVRRRDDTIYRSQLRSRLDAPGHRLQAGLPLLSALRSEEVMTPPRLVLQADDSVARARSELGRQRLPGAPVTDDQGILIGSVAAADLASAPPEQSLRQVVDVTAPSVRSAAALDVALEALAASQTGWLAVTDSGQRVVGILTAAEVIGGYRRALGANVARLSALTPDTVSAELTVADGAAVAGRPLSRVGLPPGVLVVTVEHEGGLVFADGETVLHPGDVVSALVPESARARLSTLVTEPVTEPTTGGPGPQADPGDAPPESTAGGDGAPSAPP
jgi:H+/Cl- antiporter ClcA/CBS domain-containing protein